MREAYADDCRGELEGQRRQGLHRRRACILVRAPRHPHSFIGLDGQGGGLHGASNEDDNATAVAVDTPDAITDQPRAALTEADVVVVPARPSVRDVDSAKLTLGIVEEVAPCAIGVLAVNGRTRFLKTRVFEPEVNRWETHGWNVFRVPQSVVVPWDRRQGGDVVAFAPHSKVAEA